LALAARDAAAPALDRGGHRAAAGARPDPHASRTGADCEISIVPRAVFVAVTIATTIAANLHVDIGLRDLKAAWRAR
jgi:hypothetical protein